MSIDEDRIHVLTKYSTRNGIKKKVESDHNILICDTNITVYPKKKVPRTEILNYQPVDCQKRYKEILDNGDSLTNCFKGNAEFCDKANNWFAEFMNIVNKLHPARYARREAWPCGRPTRASRDNSLFERGGPLAPIWRAKLSRRPPEKMKY